MSRNWMLEDQYQKLEPLLHGLVHEIRNPVQGILASADALLCMHEENATTGKLLQMIQQECVRIDQLLSDLLDLARPMTIDRTKKESLGRVVEESIRDFHQRNSPIRITSSIPVNLQPMHMNPTGIRRAVLAILQNAVESKQEDWTIQVILEDARDQLILRIEDNGEGISPQHLDQVSRPFFSTRPKKAGLGLSIAERIVRSHGGQMQIEPVQSGGTAVTFRFPVEL